MGFKTISSLFVILLSTVFYATAQGLWPDSLKYSKAATQAIAYFNNVIGEGSEIYSGKVYVRYPPANKGTFYFLDKNFCIPGLVRYNGTWYKSVPVLYDVYNDIMVSESNDTLFVLNTGKIADVLLMNHHFVNITTNTNDDFRPGFYDLLYDGKLSVLEKRVKIIDEHIVSAQTPETFYIDQSILYVKKDDQYFRIDNKRSLLKLFREKKKVLKQFIRDNKIDYNRDKEQAIVKLAARYDLTDN